MATKPSWLEDEDTQQAAVSAATTVAKNPAAQKAFWAAASDKNVQQAVTSAVTSKSQPIDDDDTAPNWAKSTWNERPSEGPTKDIESQKPSPAPSPAPASTKSVDLPPLSAEEMAAMNRYSMILKLGYMGAATLMAISAGLSLTGQTNIGKIFFGLYVIFFCTMICCFEVGMSFLMKYIAINFGFLYTMPGRTFFVLFVGFMSYSLGVFGIISMAVLCGVLIMHYIVRCMHPRFEEYMRKKDYAGK